ncbi:HlyU family transcriptional regulator [Stappia sp. MMSF_3263]|uniref:HlyU family transcriptional regulator n=1 Tax=Stappia sp. MMSF_3263 TaxID=3046693 RepID=UPI00273D614B|nr:HlyU family transcriptional regulator [Stappia sp. MMSF_3263]
MVFGRLFGGLFGGGGKAAPRARHPIVEYKGFLVTPAPTARDGQWQVAGSIAQTGEDGETRSHDFIRADLMPSEEQAAEFAIRKARQIIDEQGERIFS